MKTDRSLAEDAASAGARLRIGYPWWLRPLLARDVAGITLGRRVYVSADVAVERLEPIVRHELVHVRQLLRHGIVRFYWRYLGEYVRSRRRGLSHDAAYRSISFEREALDAERVDRTADV